MRHKETRMKRKLLERNPTQIQFHVGTAYMKLTGNNLHTVCMDSIWYNKLKKKKALLMEVCIYVLSYHLKVYLVFIVLNNIHQ